MQIANGKLQNSKNGDTSLHRAESLRFPAPGSHVGESLGDLHTRLGETRLRGGLTLVELLVVIIIITTLVAAAIPLMAPSSVERQLREASRGVNTYIAAAQAKAISQGRPFGVALRRLSKTTGRSLPIGAGNPDNNNNVAIEVTMVEEPVPYAGFDASSRVRIGIYEPQNPNWYSSFPRPQYTLYLIQFITAGIGVPQATDLLPPGWDPDLFPDGVIRPSDVIEIDGSRYLLIYDRDDTNVIPQLDPTETYFQFFTGKPNKTSPLATQIVAIRINDTGQLLNPEYDYDGDRIGTPNATNPPFFTDALPYKILRQPVPTSDEPYQLPEGTAIDLRASGIGDDIFFFRPDDPTDSNDKVLDNDKDVVIMFSPEGRVSRVRVDLWPGGTGVLDARVVDNVYLLVGANIPQPPVFSRDPTLTTAGWNAARTDEEKRMLRDPLNWLRGDSLWIVLGAASGRVATIENNFVDPLLVFTPPMPLSATEPSEQMRSNQIIYARQFTRDMRQLRGG
jgi:type II secretory pathway pseudopilin PulG